MNYEIIKKDVDFGLKTKIDVNIAELALKYREGDILDIGCDTCQPNRLITYKVKDGKRSNVV